MKKYFIFAFVAAFLFGSLGLSFNASAGRNESASIILAATPKPQKLAQIERIELDKKEVIIPCGPNAYIPPATLNSPCFVDDRRVDVRTFVSNPKNVPLTYEYKVSGGSVTGEGANVAWDLSRVRPETYTITVSIKGKNDVSDRTETEQVVVRDCSHCSIMCFCPALAVTGGRNITASESLVFTANVAGGTGAEISYKWTVSQGEIVKGQGTPQIKVKTTPEMTGEITATVEIDGSRLCALCPRTDSETVSITK